jgi:putative DNA primase/helicase
MNDARAITKAQAGQWCGSYGRARCPARAHSTPSLKISDDKRKRNGVDLHCFAGCSWQDVKAELPRQWLIFRLRTFDRLLWGDKS